MRYKAIVAILHGLVKSGGEVKDENSRNLRRVPLFRLGIPLQTQRPLQVRAHPVLHAAVLEMLNCDVFGRGGWGGVRWLGRMGRMVRWAIEVTEAVGTRGWGGREGRRGVAAGVAWPCSWGDQGARGGRGSRSARE